jgi:hypothetical protein
MTPLPDHDVCVCVCGPIRMQAVARRLSDSLVVGIAVRMVISIAGLIVAWRIAGPSRWTEFVVYIVLYLWISLVLFPPFSGNRTRFQTIERMRAAAPDAAELNSPALSGYGISDLEVRVGPAELAFRHRDFALIVVPERAVDTAAALRFSFHVSVARAIRKDDLRSMADLTLLIGIVASAVYTLNVFAIVVACAFTVVWWKAACVRAGPDGRTAHESR